MLKGLEAGRSKTMPTRTSTRSSRLPGIELPLDQVPEGLQTVADADTRRMLPSPFLASRRDAGPFAAAFAKNLPVTLQASQTCLEPTTPSTWRRRSYGVLRPDAALRGLQRPRNVRRHRSARLASGPLQRLPSNSTASKRMTSLPSRLQSTAASRRNLHLHSPCE